MSVEEVIFSKADSYLQTLKNRLRHSFDLHEECAETRKFDIDLLATYCFKGQKHILSKKITLYALEEYEHCFVKIYRDNVTMEQAEGFAETVKGSMDYMVHPHPDHKRTILTGVMIAESGVCEAVEKFVKNFHSQKTFKFFLHGWCEVRLVLADLSKGEVVHCKRWNSRHLGKLYEVPAAMSSQNVTDQSFI